jgi:hypothetical protein
LSLTSLTFVHASFETHRTSTLDEFMADHVVPGGRTRRRRRKLRLCGHDRTRSVFGRGRLRIIARSNAFARDPKAGEGAHLGSLKQPTKY